MVNAVNAIARARCAPAAGTPAVACPLHERRERLDVGADLGEQVAVGQLAALRPAGGARGVDDRGQVVGADRPAARRCTSSSATSAPSVGQLVDRGLVAFDLPQVWRRSGSRSRIAATVAACASVSTSAALAPGVGQDPLRLLGGGGLVDRHGDARPRPRSRSRSASTRSGSCDINGDPVAGLDAGRDSPFATARPGRRTLRGDVHARCPPPAGGSSRVREPLGVHPHDVRQVLVVGHRASSAGALYSRTWTSVFDACGVTRRST